MNRARQTTQPGGIGSLELILGLLKSLKIQAQYPIDLCSLFQWLKARPMWRAKQQEKNNAKFDNFAKEVSTVFTKCIALNI
jgi:hypothetical protein